MTRLLPLVLAAGLLAACTGDPATAPSASTTTPEAVSPAPATSTPAPATSAPDAPTRSAAATPAFDADESPDRGTESGGPLTVTAVRAARQDGFDRVVFELQGKVAGVPGWRVEYVDAATQQGSGRRVDVQGEAVLQVTLLGVGYPFDTGQEEASQDLTPEGTGVLREVDLQGTYEGQFQAFVGLRERRPFRVFRLSDPARVVVDVRDR